MKLSEIEKLTHGLLALRNSMASNTGTYAKEQLDQLNLCVRFAINVELELAELTDELKELRGTI